MLRANPGIRGRNSQIGVRLRFVCIVASFLFATSCRSTQKRALDAEQHLTPSGAVAACGNPTRDEIATGGDPPSRVLTYERPDGTAAELIFKHSKPDRRWVFVGVGEGNTGDINTFYWFDVSTAEIGRLFPIFPCLDSVAAARSSPQPDTPPTLKLYEPQVNGVSVTMNGLTQPTTPGAMIDSVSWDFGDGSPAITNDFPVTHDFPHPGAFTVTAIASDSFGLSQSAKIVVTVSSLPQPTLRLDLNSR